MRFLCIDTSSPYSVVAIGDSKRLLAGGRRLFARRRADGLFSLLAACLKKSLLSLSDIDAIGVGLGPGSFTGLRIGVAAIKGLAYASRKPCFSFSSLDAVAFSDLPVGIARLAVLVDARRSSVYAKFYAREDGRPGGWRARSKDLLLERSLAQRRLGRAQGMALAGDGSPFFSPADPAVRPCRARILPRRYWHPTPAGIWRLTVAAAQAGPALDAVRLLPVYLYPPDCQVRAARKKDR